MKEYRCTRNDLYQHECLGQINISARQGYYVFAENEEEAWEMMATRYPQESVSGFTVQEWRRRDVVVQKIF